jgi:hypothetical protein
MKLSNVLGKVENSKTASVASSAAPATSEKTAAAADTAGALRTALKEAVSAPATEKQASAASPVGDLMKTANDIATAEHEKTVKEAQLYGASVFDGFMARAAQYGVAAEKVAQMLVVPQQEKAASAAPAADTFDKFAAENPALVQQAAQLGYKTAAKQLEKLAEAAYEKGYNETVTAIYKQANSSFVSGYEDTLRLLTESR